MTTWDPSAKGSNIALSGSDLIASASGSGGTSTQYVLTTTAKSSGKWAIRLTGDLRDGGVGGTYCQGGITTDVASVEGNDTDSYHLYQQGSDEWDLRHNGSRVAFEYPTGSFPTMPDGTDELLILLNLDDGLLYFRFNGNYFLNSEVYPNPPDPTTPVGGIPIAAGTYYIYRVLYTTGFSVTLDPNPTGLPSGYTAWDAGGGGGVTGTLGATESADTAAFTGFANASGTLAATEAADTAAFTSNVRWTATLAATEAADTASFSGAVRWTATLATTEAADTAAFTGNVRWTATLTATEAADTAAFTGFANASGTLAATESVDTAAFAGAVGNVISGTLAATEAADTAAFTGAVRWTATLGATEAADIAAITAFIAASGILATTENPDTAAFTGSVALGPITGILAATERADAAQFIAQTRGEAPGVLNFGRRVTINRW